MIDIVDLENWLLVVMDWIVMGLNNLGDVLVVVSGD